MCGIEAGFLYFFLFFCSGISHPNLVQLFGVCVLETELHVVMELVVGKDLVVLRKKVSCWRHSPEPLENTICVRSESTGIIRLVCNNIPF